MRKLTSRRQGKCGESVEARGLDKASRLWPGVAGGRCLTAVAAFAVGALASSDAFGQTTRVWTSGETGSFSDSSKYNNGAPVAGDSVTADAANSVINFAAADSITLATLALAPNSGTPIFNQDGGTLGLTTLTMGGGGASRNPTYNLLSGTLNVSTNFTFGNGSNSRFVQSGGTVNHSGSSLSMGTASGARSFIVMTGGVFNANSVGQMNVGNVSGGNGQGTIDLSGNAQFNATAATLVIGQFGAATSSATNTLGTLSMSGTSTLTTGNVVVGGNNAPSAVNGIVNLNGGTIVAGSVRKGNSTLTPDATTLVLNANGGTIRATTSAFNANYFANLFVNLAAGGLTFDTNSNAIGISNAMSGVGGLTKNGSGTMTLTGANSYAGATTANAGTLLVNGATTGQGSYSVGATATLGGTGTIGLAGSQTVNVSGTLAPGASAGILDITGAPTVNLNGGSVYSVELGGPTAGDGVGFYDQLNVPGGIVAINGTSVLRVALQYDAAPTDTFTILTAGNVSGAFSNASAVGGTGLFVDSVNGTSGTVTYTADSIILSNVVPEPMSLSLIGVGALGLLSRRRRQRDRA